MAAIYREILISLAEFVQMMGKLRLTIIVCESTGIFEMYFRGNERSKGNGLGLYIVKKAAEKLNGVVEFETQWGHGSTFRLRFIRP